MDEIMETETKTETSKWRRTSTTVKTSSTTKTTTMTTPAKLYGKDLSEYDEVDVEALLAQLSPEEINILAKEVDPDDNFLPPNQRCSYECTKDPTGPLDRKKLIEHINKEALETPDLPEIEPFVKGTVRGKKWVAPPRDDREIAADEQIAIDMGEEYEHALSDATQEEIIDLAAILGFHSMMNQDQYHASLLNKGQPIGMGWDGITKSTTQKLYPMDPPNNTDIDESIKRVKDDDSKLIELNLNNIKNISDEKLEQLFNALPQNEHLEVLSLTNVGLTDKTALLLAEAIEKSKTLRVLNVETNFISPPVIVVLVKSLLKARTIEEFRASNQRSTVLGNKIEMEITDLVEKNTSLLRLGLHLEFNDARHRVAGHLQRNIDRNEHEFRKGSSSSPIPNAASPTGKVNDLSAMLSKQNTKSPKPIHLVLTPQERIDSKSELIASLESQKLSDRGKGEISVAVPQLAVKKKSPSMERKPSAKDRISPIKAKEEPKAVEEKKAEVKTELKRVEITIEKQSLKSDEAVEKTGEEKKTFITPYAAIDESVDKTSAVDMKETQKAEESDKTDANAPQTPYPSIDESVDRDIEIREPKANMKVPPTPSPSIEESFVLNSANHPEEKKLSPQRNPKIGELRDSRLSKAFDQENFSPSGSVQKDNEPEKDLMMRTSTEVTSVVNQPETVVTDTDKEPKKSDDSFKNRDRLPQSISPSRHMEDKLTQLRAKIDSFAEVADEKMASLRLRYDDIPKESLVEDAKAPKPRAKPIIPDVDIAKLKMEVRLAEEKAKEPANLPPLRPGKDASLVKTPNSIGITMLFQKQIFTNTIPKSVSAIPANVSEPSNEKVGASTVTTPSPKLNEKHSPVLLQNPDSPNLGTGIVLALQKSDNPDTFMGKVSGNPSQQTLEGLNPKLENISSKDIENPVEKIPEAEESIPISKPPSEQMNPESLKAASRATALSLLSITKRDGLNIDPINKIESATQSQPKPSPFLRLRVKKGDSQTIDPVALKEAATQSLTKPNPISLLSIKKGETITIDPILKSEVSTQFAFEKLIAEAASQTVEEDPKVTSEDATQTPLVFSSLEHDFIFPGLRRVPHLPRPKTINIGGGEKVIVKPSSKPINEILMLLYPVLQDYAKPKESKGFGLEQDILKTNDPDNTINDLEDSLKKAAEISETIIKASPKPIEETIESEEEVKPSVRTEIEIPLADESKTDEPIISIDECATAASEARFETKFTAVEKVSAITRTTIETEEHVEVIDKAYKSIAEVSTSEREHGSKTSIRSANMWQALSSNLIKASEQTLFDLSKSTEKSDGVSLARSKIGKVSVYSSVEDLSRSKFSDRTLGNLIKTVETTSVYSSTEDIPYTKYSDRYKEGKVTSTASVYSSTEDLPQLSKPIAKTSIYSSTEDLPDVSYKKYSNRYSDTRTSQFSVDSPKAPEKPKEHLSLLPRSKFSDRYKDDHPKPVEIHRSHPKFPTSHDVSQTAVKIDRGYYKSANLSDHSTARSQYKSTEELFQRSKIGESSTSEAYKYHDKSYLASVQSSISRHQSALRPYTYVPSTAHTDLSIDHVRARPTSPSMHTATLQLNISPSGISELPQKRASRYTAQPKIDNPTITISRVKDTARSFRAISPIEKPRQSKHFLLPHHKASGQAIDDDSYDESSQSTLDISFASTADNATSTTESTKKRPNIMDTIKMLKNRVRDVITTEDRFTESHRLPSSP